MIQQNEVVSIELILDICYEHVLEFACDTATLRQVACATLFKGRLTFVSATNIGNCQNLTLILASQFDNC